MRRVVQKPSKPITKIIYFLQLLGKPLFQVLLIFIYCFFFCLAFLTQLNTSLSKGLKKVIHLFHKKKFSFYKPRLSTLFLTAILVFFAFQFYFKILKDLPKIQDITNHPRLSTQILDRNGRLLFQIYQDENRTLVKLDDLPDYLKNAFLAIEDKDFYKHGGVSITGITRALYHNLFKNQNEGGSTITQQLVKNTLLSSEQTLTRKFKEIILALQAEHLYTKDQILELYLNEVGFGGPTYGIQEAAHQYFNLDAKNLNPAQAALLAGLPKAPSKFSPFLDPNTALKRQRLVLEKMYQNGYLDQNTFTEAVNTKLEFSSPKINIQAPHFVMYVRDLLIDQFGEDLVNRGGLKVTTSLDLDLQKTAEKAIDQELSRIQKLNVKNGAALIIRPQSGEILAMVGSKNYFDIKNDGQVNLTTSLRQPGSSIKPINYALALENGLTANTLISDAPVSFPQPGSSPWVPRNYDGRFHGQVTLRQALANSYNIPAIILLAKNGVDNMVKLGQKMGITTWNDPSQFGLSLTLGAVEVKMIDLATVYATLANNGLKVPLNPILKIETPTQNLDFNPCPTQKSCLPEQVIKPETAFIISDILSDNYARSSAFGPNSVLNLPKFKAAVKTGTSNDLRDNWTVGYTPDFVVATWVGNNDNQPMNQIASGITGASPIWNRLMTQLLSQNLNNTSFSPPNNLVKIPLCSLNGIRYEFFIQGTQPKNHCNPPTTLN